MRQGVQGVRGKGIRASTGFTILEIIIVLFLLVGLLGIILPRISLDENLGSVGRRMVGIVRSLARLAVRLQTIIELVQELADERAADRVAHVA